MGGGKASREAHPFSFLMSDYVDLTILAGEADKRSVSSGGSGGAVQYGPERLKRAHLASEAEDSVSKSDINVPGLQPSDVQFATIGGVKGKNTECAGDGHVKIVGFSPGSQ